MIFQPGTYYVGDPGFVLGSDDLRSVFYQMIRNKMVYGERCLDSSRRFENGMYVADFYWMAPTPHPSGTLYDQDNKGWGFDWGCFGVIPWKWIDCQGSYESNKIEFTKPFECSFTEDNITIGHLHFTFSPK